MKPSESNIVDVECSSVNIKEIKKMIYRGLEIYAVKRSTNYSYAECSLLGRCNKAWWCGYVEVPLNMYSLFEPRGYPDTTILDKLVYSDSCDLAHAHGGYTYIGYGIPRVLDDPKVFIGWDYNHYCDIGIDAAYSDVINEGKRVADSMLNEIRRSGEKECKQ